MTNDVVRLGDLGDGGFVRFLQPIRGGAPDVSHEPKNGCLPLISGRATSYVWRTTACCPQSYITTEGPSSSLSSANNADLGSTL